MNRKELINDIRRRAFEAGSQKQFAKDNGMRPSHLSGVIHGHRDFTDKQLEQLGYRMVLSYEPISSH